MAARVQNDNTLLWQVAQGVEHAFEIQAMRCCVVVGVVHDFEARAFKQGAVVFPARVADRNLGIWHKLLNKVCTDFECTGAAQSLHRQHATVCNQ